MHIDWHSEEKERENGAMVIFKGGRAQNFLTLMKDITPSFRNSNDIPTG